MTPTEALAIYAWNVLHDRTLAHENTKILRAAGLVEFRRQYDESGRWVGSWDDPTEAGEKAGLRRNDT